MEKFSAQRMVSENIALMDYAHVNSGLVILAKIKLDQVI
jgi:hypothetical protein